MEGILVLKTEVVDNNEWEPNKMHFILKPGVG